MPELNEANFELIDKNKAEQHERQKIKFLEDRIKVLESAIESHAKILARFQMTENEAEFEKHEKLWEIKTWVIIIGVMDQVATNLTRKIE